jgi:hypothetical protein
MAGGRKPFLKDSRSLTVNLNGVEWKWLEQRCPVGMSKSALVRELIQQAMERGKVKR